MYLSTLAAALPAALLLALSGPAAAASSASQQGPNPQAFAEQAAAALQVSARPDRRIPPQYIKQADCIAVFPEVGTNNSSGMAANNSAHQYLGLVDCRKGNGQWASTAPVFVTLSGNLNAGTPKRILPNPKGVPGLSREPMERAHGPYGPLGHQLIVLFVSPGATNALRQGAVDVGKMIATHASVAGPTHAQVLAWRTNPRSGYSNVDISKTTIGFASAENHRIYGRDTRPHQLLNGNVPAGEISSTLTAYTQALEDFAPASQYAGNKSRASLDSSPIP